MFCTNCGKELKDGTKFCPICGSKQEITEPAPVVEEPAPVAQEPVPVAEEPAPVAEEPKPKKKKGKGKAIIISVAAIVAVLGISVAAAFPYVKDFVAKTFLPADKYYQSIESSVINDSSENIVTTVESIKKWSDTARDNFKALKKGESVKGSSHFEGKKISTDLTVSLGDSLMSLLSDMAVVDLTSLNEVTLGIDVSQKEDLASFDLNFLLGKDKVITAQAVMDINGDMYVSVPELSDTAMKFNIYEMAGVGSLEEIYNTPEMEEAFDAIFALIDALPSGEECADLVDTYTDVVLENLDDVEKSTDTVSVGDIEKKVTVIEVTIDEKTLEKVVLSLAREMEDDDVIWDFLEKLVALDSGANAKEYVREMKDMFEDFDKDDIKGAFEGFGEIKLNTFVDAKGSILGREIEYMDYTFSFITLENGKNIATEIIADIEGMSFEIKGEGTLKKDTLNGTYTITAMSQDIAEIEVKNFNIKDDNFNGTFTVKPSKTISSMLSAYETDDIEDELGVSLDSLGIDLSDIALVIDFKGEEEKSSFSLALMSKSKEVVSFAINTSLSEIKSINVPEKFTKVASEEDIEKWASTIDPITFISSLPQPIADIISQFEYSSEDNEDDYYYDEDYYLEEYEPEPIIYPENALVMATNAYFEPYAYYQNGLITGMDIEIADAIAQHLGMELYIDDMDFDSITYSVENSDTMVGMSAMTATEERLERVNFTIPYLTNTQTVLVKFDSPITSIDDIYSNNEIRIGTKNGTTASIYASSDFYAERLSFFSTYNEVTDALKNGFVDCVIVDRVFAEKYILENTDLMLLCDYSVEEYSICVNKENPELLEKINVAITELTNNGTIASIYQRYISDEAVSPRIYLSDSVSNYPSFEEDDYNEELYYEEEYTEENFAEDVVAGFIEGLANSDYTYDDSYSYDVNTPSYSFDTTFGQGDGIEYEYKEEKVMDDYYYNDYYYSDRHTEDYFEDYGY